MEAIDQAAARQACEAAVQAFPEDGVLRTTPSGTELWRPQGWPATEPLAAALSDDGAQVAVLLGNEVFLLRSDSAGTD